MRIQKSMENSEEMNLKFPVDGKDIKMSIPIMLLPLSVCVTELISLVNVSIWPLVLILLTKHHMNIVLWAGVPPIIMHIT